MKRAVVVATRKSDITHLPKGFYIQSTDCGSKVMGVHFALKMVAKVKTWWWTTRGDVLKNEPTLVSLERPARFLDGETQWRGFGVSRYPIHLSIIYDLFWGPSALSITIHRVQSIG